MRRTYYFLSHGSRRFFSENSSKSNEWNNISQKIRHFEDSVVLKDLQDFTKEMRRRKYNLWWLTIPVGCTFGFLGFGGYNLIKKWTTKEVSGFSADVIEKVLEDPATQKVVDKFCQETIARLVYSPEIKDQVNKLLGDAITHLAQQDYIKEKLGELFYYVFLTETVKNGGSQLSSQVVQDLINGEKFDWLRQEIYKYIANEIQKVTEDREIQERLNQVAWRTVTSLFKSSVAEPRIKQDLLL